VKKTVRMEYAQRWIVTYSSLEKKETMGRGSYRHPVFPQMMLSMVKEISDSQNTKNARGNSLDISSRELDNLKIFFLFIHDKHQ
jgi:hypothetical protein